jgi:hypothetical protein
MSPRPIALSPDLLRLQNDGYDIDVKDGHLFIRDVPYVNDQRRIERGTLISTLNLSGETAQKPDTHVAHWCGSHPCHSDGRKITSIENPSTPPPLPGGLAATFTFSAKADYRDYHHKMTTYIGRITGEAQVIDASVTAQTYPAIPTDNPCGPFKYEDTASSRAGISAMNAKVAGKKIGILGAGGTGAYILDLVSKTCVALIRVIDGDVFSQHNAFRAPGAPSLEQLRGRPQKVDYLKAIYSNMHNGVEVHNTFLTEANLHLLDGLDFVFIAMDRGEVKRLAVDRLTANGTSFIDVGMGVSIDDGRLRGLVRSTISTPETRAQAAPHLSFVDADSVANAYATNIQIAELNSLNAALAVIAWKRHCGIYPARGKSYCGYAIGSSTISDEGEQ